MLISESTLRTFSPSFKLFLHFLLYYIIENYKNIDIFVQPSGIRNFSDEEYQKNNITLKEDLSDCDLLLGVKEVPIDKLIPNKKYMFFSHTIKKQPYNRAMLRKIMEHKIRLIDYECLTWENGSRILGFGRFAGIVGMHNGFITWGKKFGLFDLKPAHHCKNYLDLKLQYKNLSLPAIKIALCGDGRVAHGVLELLEYLKIKEVTKKEFLSNTFSEPVFVHLRSEDYYIRKDGRVWDKSDFYHNPEEYLSAFQPYYKVCDMMVNAIFWQPGIPAFFTKENMKEGDFNIKVVEGDKIVTIDEFSTNTDGFFILNNNIEKSLQINTEIWLKLGLDCLSKTINRVYSFKY